MRTFNHPSLFPEDLQLLAERKRIVTEQLFQVDNDFQGIVSDAHAKLLLQAQERTNQGKRIWPNWFPQNMNWNVLDILQEKHADRVNVGTHRVSFNVSSSVTAHFKMLDGALCPKNQLTRSVEEMDTNYEVAFTGEMINVYLGWRILRDKSWDQIEGVYIVEMREHGKPKWVYNLAEAADSTGIIPLQPTAPPPVSGDGLDHLILPGPGIEIQIRANK